MESGKRSDASVTSRDIWRISRAGSLDRLIRRSDVLPPPAAGEARVRVSAIGLNFADIFACLGLYSATPEGPFVPGLEFAGIIEEVHSAANDGDVAGAIYRTGDAVYGVTRFGAYASALNAPLEQLGHVPAGWSLAEAAAFPVQGVTAYYGLVELARVKSREMVLLHSAAGGVGLSALAILEAMGARVIATVGSEEKRRFLIEHRNMPPDLVIVRRRRRFGDQLASALAAANADGFDVVFDAVAGPFFKPAFARLEPRGRFVVYGAADFMPRGRSARDPRLLIRYIRRSRIDPLALIAENHSLIGFNLIWLWDDVRRLREVCIALNAMCPDPPLVGRRFPFEHAQAALRFLQSGRSVGKVVLETAESGRTTRC